MSTARRLGFSINPLWPHYAAISTILFGVVIGYLRFFILDRSDSLHCNALLNEGQWMDYSHKNWQPEGCMLHSYRPQDASVCLASRKVVFIGDSVTRKLFFQFGQILDPSLPNTPPDELQKHSDHSLRSKAGTQIEFYWDPYLNTSRAHELINTRNALVNDTAGYLSHRPALLVLGSGLWYLRYVESGGLSAWEANIEATLGTLSRAASKAADEIVFLPIEEVVSSKLSSDRASSIRSSDIDAMNSDLYHRIHPPGDSSLLFPNISPSMPIALPMVFNRMLDPSQTDDGLHFADQLIKAQANILLNLRCNDMLPKAFPLDKTCCRSYPWPSILQTIILGVAILWGPCVWSLSYHSGQNGAGSPLIKDEQIPALVVSAAVALIFTADRTGIWLKEQKQFNPWTFAFLSLSLLMIGLITMKRVDKDLGFLNREQTDEWKGWMQIAILVYHYLGASKVSGIYNPIRVLVAAYLFQTGYGHTTFYIRKADFGFMRIAQVIVRLNFFTIVLAYTMNTDYISYYFTPLVSMWFLIIYATMSIGSQFNDRTPILIGKIILSMVLVTFFMSQTWLLETLFKFLERVFAIRWSAQEWSFRVNLDIWIVYFGMFVAIAVLKIHEHRLTDHPQWPLAVRVAIGASSIITIWFFAFELWQENKFIYNGWHPYISFLPISAFMVLRNATPVLRSASSRAFAFIGTCSLETFIIQYHFWLAGDTKGVLLVIPGTRWRPVNFIITSIMFIYVSHRVAQASGEVTKWICGGGEKKTLPTTNPAASHTSSQSTSRRTAQPSDSNPETIPLTSQNETKDDNLPEPDTPTRPTRRWVDRLADEGPSSQSSSSLGSWFNQTEWQLGVKTKLAIIFGLMWVANILWSYP